MDIPNMQFARSALPSRRWHWEQFSAQMGKTGLSFKVLLIIMSVSLIGTILSSTLVLTLQRQQLIDNSLSATTRLSDGIQASLEYAMLLNDRAMASQTIQRIVQKQGVEHIRILDASGTVAISSLPGEIGKRFDYSNATCQFCHTGAARPSNQTTIQATHDQHEALVNVNLRGLVESGLITPSGQKR